MHAPPRLMLNHELHKDNGKKDGGADQTTPGSTCHRTPSSRAAPARATVRGSASGGGGIAMARESGAGGGGAALASESGAGGCGGNASGRTF